MFVVFFSTNDVFKAEERFSKSGIACDVVPTPVQDKAYCGVCLKIMEQFPKEVLSDMEYEIVV